jgi:hypothetical protein
MYGLCEAAVAFCVRFDCCVFSVASSEQLVKIAITVMRLSSMHERVSLEEGHYGGRPHRVDHGWIRV